MADFYLDDRVQQPVAVCNPSSPEFRADNATGPTSRRRRGVASTGGEGDDDDTVRALKASILQEAAAPLSAKDLLLLLLLVQSVNTAEKGFCLLLAHKIAWAD